MNSFEYELDICSKSMDIEIDTSETLPSRGLFGLANEIVFPNKGKGS
jgi:hypothetical protein